MEDFEARGDKAMQERPAPPLATLTLLVLAYAGKSELARKLPEWRELIGQVLATNGRMALYRISRYLFILGHARGVPVDDASRQRILGCGDVATLERWFDRAVAATRLPDVLDPLAQ